MAKSRTIVGTPVDQNGILRGISPFGPASLTARVPVAQAVGGGKSGRATSGSLGVAPNKSVGGGAKAGTTTGLDGP